jgi:O-antigen/teichoic acid export membrane protein
MRAMVVNPIEWVRNNINRLRRNPLTSRMIRNSSYVFSANTLSAVLSMAQSVLAARLLGVEAFGILGAITQFASVINRITSFRMSELVVSYIGEFTSEGKKQHSAALFKAASLTEIASALIAFILLVALAPLGARVLAKDPNTVGIFILYGFSVLANFFAESSTGLLQIFDRFQSIAIITVIQGVVTLILILMAFLSDGTLNEVVIAYLVGKIIWAVLISFMALRTAREQWGRNWWKSPLSLIAERRKDLTRFAISTNLSGTINLITRDSDILWLSALSNPLQVGYYKVAKAFMNILLVPVTPLISTTYREVAREIASKRWANVRYLLRSGSLIAGAWTVPASLGLLILGPWFVMIYGPEFSPAYPIILVFLIGVIAVNIFYWNRSVLLPLGMPDFPTKIGFIAAVLQISGMLLLVPGGGAIAMAGMMSLYFLVTAGVNLWKSMIELHRVETEASTVLGE